MDAKDYAMQKAYDEIVIALKMINDSKGDCKMDDLCLHLNVARKVLKNLI